MPFQLASGVSLTFVNEIAVFLDLRSDQYVALAPDLSSILRRTGQGQEVHLSERMALHAPALDKLLDFTTASGSPFETCQLAHPVIRRSPEEMKAGLIPIFRAAWCRAKARVMLRLVGPFRTTQYLSRRSASAIGDRNLEDQSTATAAKGSSCVDRVLAAHGRLDAAFGNADKCLARSIALFEHLCAFGIRPTLVAGVRIAPFTAHCWVQLDGALLNDEIDNVRVFQPILVI